MYSYKQMLDMDVSDLINNFLSLQHDHERAVATADRLQDNVIQLQAECRRLESEVDEAREAKKALLPREVAEAIDSFKADGRDIDNIVYWLAYCPKKIENLSTRAQVLKLYAIGNGFKLISALINGYTVEGPPTTEEKITAKISAALNESGVDLPIPVEHFAHQLTLAVREVLAEARQEEE